jgi:hypothetical protein
MVRTLGIATLLFAALAAAPAQASETAYVWDSLALNLQIVALDAKGTRLTPAPLTVSGFAAGDAINALDVRPADGKLYALTVNTADNPDTMELYRIDVGDASATAVSMGPSPTFTPTGVLSMDFNPVVDRLRVISSTGQNFRMVPATGAMIDSDPGAAGEQPDANVAYAVGDANNGTAPAVVGVGYTNSFAGATKTTLFGIDLSPRRLIRVGGVDGVPSPNGGELTTIGNTGLAAGLTDGLDVSAATNALYYLRTGFFASTVFTIDAATGAVTDSSALESTAVDIALLPAATFDLAAPVVTVKESDASAVLTVNRSGPSTGAASVPVKVETGNAGGDDFDTTAPAALAFAAGETSKTITVALKNDTAIEGRETFTVRLSEPAGDRTAGAVLGRSAATVVIEDDDFAVPAPTPTATATPTPPKDTTAPTLAVKGRPATMRRSKFLKGFTLTITPSEAATIDVALRATPKKGAFTSSYELGLFAKRLGLAAGARKLKVKPAKKLVGRIRKTTKVRLTLEATDAAGNRSTLNRTIKIKK